MELAPPSPGELPVAIADLSTKVANLQKQAFRDWTVRQTAVNVVVGVEVACWFFIGECIGKGGLVSTLSRFNLLYCLLFILLFILP